MLYILSSCAYRAFVAFFLFVPEYSLRANCFREEKKNISALCGSIFFPANPRAFQKRSFGLIRIYSAHKGSFSWSQMFKDMAQLNPFPIKSPLHNVFWHQEPVHECIVCFEGPLTTSVHRRHHDGEEQDPAGWPVSCHTSCGSVLFLHTHSYQTGFFVFCLHSGQAVALIIFILGLGTLLPWNFFITASQVSHLRAKKHF